MVYTKTLEVATEGNCHLVDITEQVQRAVSIGTGRRRGNGLQCRLNGRDHDN